ncbi:MAG: transglutaminase family protein [Planctomycetota bacterium JB042]
MRWAAAVVGLALATLLALLARDPLGTPPAALEPPEANALVRLEFELRPALPVKDLVLAIALPDDLPGRQTVVKLHATHPMREVRTARGNRIGRFVLPEVAERTTVTVEVEMRVRPFDLASRPAAAPLAAVERVRALAPEAEIEADHPEIVALAEGIEGERLAWIEAALARVHDRVRYGGYVFERPGALATLRGGEGDCSDQTDLLVALCRAGGVPARHAYGLELRGRTTNRHSWAEIAHPDGGWFPVDPLNVRLGTASFDALPADRVLLMGTALDDELAPYWYYRYDSREGALEIVFRPTLRIR